GRRAAPGPGGVPRAPRGPVRLLLPGDGARGRQPARGAPASERRRDPDTTRGQPVPLHGLPQHRRGSACGRGARRVIPARFEYEVATSVAHAIDLLGNGDGARLLAGGQSLVPLLKQRAVRPALVVDLGRLDDLRY